MIIELSEGEMYFIETGLDFEIESLERRLTMIVDGSEKQKAYRNMVWMCNRIKMKLLNYRVLYLFISFANDPDKYKEEEFRFWWQRPDRIG